MLLALGAVLSVSLASTPRTVATTSWHTEGRSLATGVEHLEMVRKGADPAVVNLARVVPGHGAELRAVLAHDVVGPTVDGVDRETTSSMCARAGGAVCINGDFATCYSCGEPFGGVVDGGRVLRSFRAGHEQLSMVDGRLTDEPQRWAGRVVATYRSPGRQPVVRTLGLDGLNVNPVADGAVLYTPEWGTTTPVVGGVHLRLSPPGPVRPGDVAVAPLALHRNVEQVPIGGDAIVSADGVRADEAARFWDDWTTTDATEKELVLTTEIRLPASVSIGGHPRLLHGGERLPLNEADPKVRDRHPRTLVGWNDEGEMLLVTVDGRQSRSQGMTLHEATDLLLELGATEGMNLDGGGSTTFVARCDRGLCVANRPSGGGERPVPVALVLIAAGDPPVAAAPPPPEPPPPAAPDPASEPAPPPPPPPPPAPPAPPPPPPPAPPPAVEPPPEPVKEPEPPPPPNPDPDAVRREIELALALHPGGGAGPASVPISREVPTGAVVLAALLLTTTSTQTLRRIIDRATFDGGRPSR